LNLILNEFAATVSIVIIRTCDRVSVYVFKRLTRPGLVGWYTTIFDFRALPADQRCGKTPTQHSLLCPSLSARRWASVSADNLHVWRTFVHLHWCCQVRYVQRHSSKSH